MNWLVRKMPFVLKWLAVTHTIEEGVSRFIDGVLTGSTVWKTGSMVMSKRDFLGYAFWGAKGEVEDVRPLVPYLDDASLAKKVAEVIRQYQVKWTNV